MSGTAPQSSDEMLLPPEAASSAVIAPVTGPWTNQPFSPSGTPAFGAVSWIAAAGGVESGAV